MALMAVAFEAVVFRAAVSKNAAMVGTRRIRVGGGILALVTGGIPGR
jgi:hypothetical protein